MIKKVLGFLLFISVFLINNSTYADTWSYRWDNTYIKVPINESIYNYSFYPVANLYHNEVKLTNTNIIYNRSGDWLYYLKDVDTSRCKEYKVWYKVSELNYNPGTCPNYKQLITFKVFDNIAPKIKLLQNEINIPINSDPKKIDFSRYYQIIDNLENDCKDSYNYDLIDFNKKGSYKLFINAVDSEGNSDSQEIKVNIKDQSAPIVNFLGVDDKLTFEINKKINLKEYFKAIDNVDGNVIDSIKIEGLDENKIGLNKNVKVSFNDSEGNKSDYYIDVMIVDSIFPKIILNEQQIKLQYETEFTDALFRKYISEANDGDLNLLDEVSIDYSSLENKVGSYDVIYSLTDSDGNVCKATLKVNLASLVKPTITTSNIKINVGENVDFNDYFQVFDPSDNNCENNTKVDIGGFDNLTPGIYYITITCNNSSGLYNTGIIEVTVKPKSLNTFFTPERIIILILIILIILGVGIYYFIKWKRKKSFLVEE